MLQNLSVSDIIALLCALITAASTIYAGKMGKTAKDAIEYARNMFGSRESVESRSPLKDRVAPGLGIKEIRIANFTSNAWLNVELVDTDALSSRSEMVQLMEELITKEDIRLKMVITAPDSEAANEAIRSKKVINMHTTMEDREKLFYCAYYAIHNNIQPGGAFHKSFTENNFMYRVTDVAMPYGIFQVIYEDESKDHIKLDLYSPYISREKERRSIFIYKDKNPEDYNYFSKDFDNMFMNAISPTEEKKFAQAWVEKAKEFYR
ncbi:MAG: hypothetical protein IKT63_05925 [Oscillospiraceae bacterium]|nr:hypothetical protein [Oscillospiraceae bacterium]